MKLVLSLLAFCGLSVWVTVKAKKARQTEAMSFAWLNEQERAALKRSTVIDGPAWKWPVNKVVNEHGVFNAQRLRSKAS